MFIDKVFSANARSTNHPTLALAKWLTIEQLQKLSDKEEAKSQYKIIGQRNIWPLK